MSGTYNYRGTPVSIPMDLMTNSTSSQIGFVFNRPGSSAPVYKRAATSFVFNAVLPSVNAIDDYIVEPYYRRKKGRIANTAVPTVKRQHPSPGDQEPPRKKAHWWSDPDRFYEL